VAGLLVTLPFLPHRQVCLPVLARLWHPTDTTHTKLLLAHQLIRLVAARYPDRQVHAVADAAYAGHSPLGLPERVSLTSRLRRDAALYALPPARQLGQQGRPRRKGDRLPSLDALARLPTTIWQPTTVRRYGKQATVTLAAVTCLWYHVHRTRPVQVVPVREPGHTEGFDLALISTDFDATPSELVERYSARWGIEVTFLESKHLVGVGQARKPPPPRGGAFRAVRVGLPQPARLLVHPQRACHRRRLHRPRARALVPAQHTPSPLDMLVAFRRAMLAEYRRAHPAQRTGTKLTDALLSWDITVA
jgi:hypothetical protein